MIEFPTGKLSRDQLKGVLDTLPGDITFADADGTIIYYNEPRTRLFGRRPAILGTSVESCHPEKSIPLVRQILADFKSGAKDGAEFQAKVDGRLIQIRYFAVRGAGGDYLGCLEFAQDVSSATPRV